MENKFPAWYLTRPEDEIIFKLQPRVIIITGAPGVGKTSFSQALAECLGYSYIYFLGHHWVTEEDLFVKIDPARVAALAAGREIREEDAYRPGVLLRAVIESQKGGVVLCLDEWDKCPDRCDALLLDFLQTGRVHGPFGEVWSVAGDLRVVITSNGMRPLAEPLLRRGFRYQMGFLSAEQEAQLLRKATGLAMNVCKAIVAFANLIRSKGVSSPSLQEMILLAEACKKAASAKEVEFLVRGFLVKEEEDEEALRRAAGEYGAALWGEIVRGRSK